MHAPIGVDALYLCVCHRSLYDLESWGWAGGTLELTETSRPRWSLRLCQSVSPISEILTLVQLFLFVFHFIYSSETVHSEMNNSERQGRYVPIVCQVHTKWEASTLGGPGFNKLQRQPFQSTCPLQLFVCLVKGAMKVFNTVCQTLAQVRPRQVT